MNLRSLCIINAINNNMHIFFLSLMKALYIICQLLLYCNTNSNTSTVVVTMQVQDFSPTNSATPSVFVVSKSKLKLEEVQPLECSPRDCDCDRPELCTILQMYKKIKWCCSVVLNPTDEDTGKCEWPQTPHFSIPQDLTQIHQTKTVHMADNDALMAFSVTVKGWVCPTQ